jgi:hypothetical protein
MQCCDIDVVVSSSLAPVLGFLNNLWAQEPSRYRVVIPASQATQPAGIASWESILGLLKSLKIRAQCTLFTELIVWKKWFHKEITVIKIEVEVTSRVT